MIYDPEYLLVQSGLDPAGALGFLHENFLQFIDEEAIEDVCEASCYLSSASLLLSSSGSRGWGGGAKSIGIDRAAFSGLEEGDAAGGGEGGGGVVEACAGSVVTRGLMFANQHPAPRRFLPLKAPTSSFVNQARECNVQALGESVARLSMVSRGGGSAVRLIGVEFLPFLRKLSEAPSHAWINRCGATPRSWAYVWQGSVKIVENAFQDQKLLGSSGGVTSVCVEEADVKYSTLDTHDEIEEDE